MEGLSINTNIAAYYARSSIARGSRRAASSIARLSSGNRIVRAADDVAAMSTGTSLRTNVTTLRMALINTSQGSSMLQVADGALAQVTDILQRQKAIAVQASAGSLSGQERSFLNQEFQNLTSEIDRLASQTNFNGVTLLDGSLFDVTQVATTGTSAAEAMGRVSFSQNVAVAIGGVNLILNGQTITIGDATEVSAGVADVERGTSLQATLDNLVNFLNNSSNTNLSVARYAREGNNLVIYQRSGGLTGQGYTIENSIARSTALSSSGTSTGARIGNVEGGSITMRYEQLLGFTAANTNVASAVTTAGGAGVIQAGASALTLNNLAGGTTSIALTNGMTLENVLDAVNAVSATTGITARLIGGGGAYGIQFETRELSDIGLNAQELAANNLLETGTTGKLQLRSNRYTSTLLSTDIGAGAIFTDGVAFDVNGLGGTTAVAATGSMVDLIRSLIRDYSVMEEGATGETDLGLSATVEWVDDRTWQMVLSSDRLDVLTVGAGGAAVGSNNLDVNIATEVVELQGADNDGLRSGSIMATGVMGDSILTSLSNSRAAARLAFTSIADANLVTSLNREVIGITAGYNAAVNSASESGGAMHVFQFFDAETAGISTDTALDAKLVEIGDTLEETLDNLVASFNRAALSEASDGFALRQLRARREGLEVVLEYDGLGDATNRESASNTLAVYSNIAQTDMAISGASTDTGRGFGGITNSTTVQYTSLNNGTTSGINAANVMNADFVGKISGFTADFYGINNQVNLSLTVGGITYQANAIATNPTSNQTIRMMSDNGGFLDIDMAGGACSNITSQQEADILAARLNQAFSTVTFYQRRKVESYQAAGDILTNGEVTGSLTGTSFELQRADFSSVTIDKINVTAPPEGSAQGSIEFTLNGEIYRNQVAIGGQLAEYGTYQFVSLTNPQNILTFQTGATALQFDTAENAAQLQAALQRAFGIGSEESGQSLRFQVGVTTQDTLNIRLKSITTSTLFEESTLDVLTSDHAAEAADVIDDALDKVTSVRAQVGSLQSRFDFAAANIESSIQNQDAARGVLLDTDIATESSSFASAQVSLQAGISVLAQANLLPQNLLKLIEG